MKPRKYRIQSILLTLSLVCSLFNVSLAVSAEESIPFAITDPINRFEIKQGTPDSLNEVSSELSKDSLLWATYSLNDLSEADVAQLSEGVAYPIFVPTYLQSKTSNIQDIEIRIESFLIGTVKFSGNDVNLYFNVAELKNLPSSEFPLQDMYFGFAVNLDMNQIGGRQDIILNTDKDHQVNVKVTDNAPKNSEINGKTGEFDPATKTILWKVKLSKETAVFDQNTAQLVYQQYDFLDELGLNQSYVDGTFLINQTSVTPVYNETAHTLQVTLIDGIQSDMEISYQTKADNSLLYTHDPVNDTYILNTPTESGLAVNNHAQLFAPGTTDKISDKTAQASFELDNWLVKKGKSVDFANRTMTWELTLDTNGCSFQEITVYDHMNTDLTFVGSITVTAADSGNVDYTINNNFTGKGILNNNSDNQKLLTLNQPRATVYTIQYKTEFPSSILDTQSTTYDNTAWLDYSWDLGITGNPPVNLSIPAIKNNYEIKAAYVQKSATYNTENHQLTWTVEINRNRNAISNLIVEDQIDYNAKTSTQEDKQNFVPGSAKIISVNGSSVVSGVSLQCVQDSTDDKHLKMTFTGLSSTDCIVVEYNTEAMNKAFYANNAKETFHNQAKVFEGTTPLQTVNAQKEFESVVLEKQAIGYDYSNHTIQWKVNVNKNKDVMPNVTLKDTLPAYLNLDQTSIRLDNNILSSDTLQDNYYTLTPQADGSNQIEFFLKEYDVHGVAVIDKSHEIVYSTELMVDNVAGFSFATDNAKTYEAKNDISLRSDNYSPVNVVGSQKILNDAFHKSSKLNLDQLNIDYSITINQAMANLGTGQQIIVDTLPEGLLLDLASVKVFPATVDKNGKGTKKSGTTAKSDVNISLDGYKLKLDLNLKNEIERSSAWIVTYTADIVVQAGNYSLTNEARLNDLASGIDSSDTVNFSLSATQAGAAKNQRRDIVVKVIDKTTNQPLSGVSFDLIGFVDPTNPYRMLSGITDSKGEITFGGLRIDKTYQIKQTGAPVGYSTIFTEDNLLSKIKDNPPLIIEVVLEKQTTSQPPQQDQTNDAENSDSSSAQNVHTADLSNPLYYGLLAFISGTILIGLCFKRKRMSNK